MTTQTVLRAVFGFSALVPALLLHEVAHGWVAWKCGDPTAKESGRLSLNPLRHVDPFMSVVLPAFLALSGSRVLFGGAKPVPISLWRCRNPRRAYWMIAVAGPAANFLQAAAGALLLRGLLAAVDNAAAGGSAWGG
ncbi:MAG: site-2 protease family protein, partial [Kiritimatiellae bacterium]|nr:site-2 protease family protein [Kiritimatiellia bacterium]